jgi:hypothetical protein
VENIALDDAEALCDEFGRLRKAAAPREGFAEGRDVLTVNEERIGGEVWILYDDNDLCAAVEDHMCYGSVAEDYARFFVYAHTNAPRAIALLRVLVERVRELEAKLESYT